MGSVKGRSILRGGNAGRFPYDQADSAAVTWPVDVDTQKLHSQIDHDADDPLLSEDFGGYIVTAVQEIERRADRSLVYQKRRQILDELPSEEAISILRSPLVEVESITYLDEYDAEQTLSTDLYRATQQDEVYFKDTSAICVADGTGIVWIDCICGFGNCAKDVPSEFRHLVQVMAEKYYDRRQIAAGGGLDEAFEKVIDRKIVAAGGSRRYV